MINGDMSQRGVVDTQTMEWQVSPSGTVSRQRVHLAGGAESGQVTSVVRYPPNATFRVHDHTDGEEIFVLQGTFSDEHGDWPAVTYLRNPEGFWHAPFSKEGCVRFVKLRQYAGSERSHVVLHMDDMDWQVSAHAEVRTKILYSDPPFLIKPSWSNGTLGRPAAPGRIPVVLKYLSSRVVLRMNMESTRHAWLRIPAGGKHTPTSAQGGELYVKTGGLPGLRSAPATET